MQECRQQNHHFHQNISSTPLGKLELAYDERVWEADNKAEPDRADHILLCMRLLKMQSMFFAVAQNALKALCLHFIEMCSLSIEFRVVLTQHC